MDIILPLCSDSFELRYALRSFELFLPHDRVIIIGERPNWLTNIIHIPFKQDNSPSKRAHNIYNKILKGFEITEQCLFCNDDHFILQPIKHMPYHHKGKMIIASDDSYGRQLKNTLKLYPGCNNFDTHCPIIYRRELFPSLTMPTFGIGIKTAYCVSNDIAGEYYPDCKIIQPMNEVQLWSTINGRMYFSCGDRGVNESFKKVLQELYPVKSRYELF